MNNSIGVFDSGVGGISILEKLVERLPYENFIYLADNKNCPYGSKSKKKIITLSIKNCRKLEQLNCKIIVVACNTSTTNSIDILREQINLPIIGIEPGIKPAINFTKTHNIGVLATKMTLRSNLFYRTSDSENKNLNVKIHEQIDNKLVNYIEKGIINDEKQKKILKSYLEPMIHKNIDCLVLGCTHYNFLRKSIKKIIPSKIKLIDIVKPVSNEVIRVIKNKNLFNKNTSKKRFIKIFYNGNSISNRYIKNEYILKYKDF